MILKGATRFPPQVGESVSLAVLPSPSTKLRKIGKDNQVTPLDYSLFKFSWSTIIDIRWLTQ